MTFLQGRREFSSATGRFPPNAPGGGNRRLSARGNPRGISANLMALEGTSTRFATEFC